MGIATADARTEPYVAHSSKALGFASVLGPALIVLGAAIRPWVDDFTDESALAEAAAAGPDRWRFGALLIALGLALSAAVAVGLVRKAGSKANAVAVTGGIGAFLVTHQLGGTGQGIAAAVDAGNNAVAHVTAAATWEMPLLVCGLIALGTTWVMAAVVIGRSGVLGSGKSLARAAAALSFAGPLIPNSAGDFVGGIGLLLLLAPPGWRRWSTRGAVLEARPNSGLR